MLEWLIPSIAIASPFIAAAVVWVGKADSRRVEAKLDVHVAEDVIIHTHVKDTVDKLDDRTTRIEDKIDELKTMLAERRK